jgi:phenylpropionate dioxygenase-like ring-hydroxylating dioxygenase large terminal subunit
MERTNPMFDKETGERLAARLQAHLDRGTTDLAPSQMSLDLSMFRDSELAAVEQDALFNRLPLLVGHTSQLRSPYDFITVSRAGNELLIIRQPDDTLACFVNACRHRGTMLVDEPCGRARRFSCPYHGWAYAPDGSLASITHAETFGPVDRSTMGLQRLPVQERHGFVWVCMRPDAQLDVEAWLGPEMDAVLRSYRLETYHYAHRLVYDESMNWKVLGDGAIDSYHLRFLHPNTIGRHIRTNIQVVDRMGGHVRFVTPRTKFDRFIRQPVGTPLDAYVIVAHLLLPNTNLIGQPSHFEVWAFLPSNDPERSRLEISFLLPQPLRTDADADFLAKNVAIARDALENEDLPVGRRIQASARGRNASPMILGRNEPINQHFHRQLAALCGAGEPAGRG